MTGVDCIVKYGIDFFVAMSLEDELVVRQENSNQEADDFLVGK